MSQTKLRYPTIYNPASQSAEEIAANFVIRLQEFNELYSAIKKDKMNKPSQHFMIQAQRGYGKTTLLLRLNHEIQNDEELRQWLLPVMFDEEQYNVHTLAKLWEEVIDVLEDQYPSFAGLSDKIDSFYDTDSPEEGIFKLLIDALKKENKKIIILLDNFGDMIEKFTKKENQRLREVLITCKYLRIIGASSTVLEFYYNYKEPLYDFFKVITLDELNSEETILLLKKLSETYKTDNINRIIETQPERIEALRRLTGGVPRTIVLLFEIFIDDVDGNSFKDLEAILDRITPLYKHRMENLSTQQQTIVDAIAQNWDAISTKDIAKKVRMSSKAVSSQLNQLEKGQLVKKISTSTKNHLYQISERFFNIYYLMRLGKRKNRNKVLWLVRFFELWCGEKELAERTQKHIKAMREGRLYHSHAFCISQALAKTAIPYDLQHELLRETKEYLSVLHSELVEEVDKSHKIVRQEITQDIFNDHFSLARKKLLDDNIPEKNIGLIIGNILTDQKKNIQKAAEYYLESVARENVNAMFNLGVLYEVEFKDYEKAKEYYLMAIKKGNSKAMNNLALLYRIEFKDNEKAIEYYLMGIEKGNINSIFNLALLYKNELHDYENAEKYFLIAIKQENIEAMCNLSSLYLDLKKNKTETLKLKKIVHINRPNPPHALGYVIALLWNNEIEESIKVYNKNCNNEEMHKEVDENIYWTFLMFIAKKQYHFVYKLFEENKFDVKDKYKPVYFALLSLMGDEYKDKYLKIGNELKQTVEEVLTEIKKMEIEYA
jgi:TPR repeat protein